MSDQEPEIPLNVRIPKKLFDEFQRVKDSVGPPKKHLLAWALCELIRDHSLGRLDELRTQYDAWINATDDEAEAHRAAEEDESAAAFEAGLADSTHGHNRAERRRRKGA